MHTSIQQIENAMISRRQLLWIRSLSLLAALTGLVALFSAGSGKTMADDWPQWRGPQRDGVWREHGIIDKFSTDQLVARWRVPISSGYSGPTVADERVFVTDRRIQPGHTERVLCFDRKTGEELWTHEYPCIYRISYPAGPRACVTIDADRAYSLGAMGHLNCLATRDGSVAWQRDLNEEYSIQMPEWGIAAAPLIENGLVILQIGGTDGACFVALDKESGEEKWRALEDRAGYSAPIIIEQAGRRVLICWTGDSIAGLVPATGEVLWRYPYGPKQRPIGIATPVINDARLFLTSFYEGSLMLELGQDRPTAKPLWHRVGENERNTEALHSIISTPIFDGEYIYGVDSYGELRCLEAASGKRIWEDLTATPTARWSTIHMVRREDDVWMLNERGELIISQLSPAGYEEISRSQLLEPTEDQLRQRGGVCWSHPAFAYGHVFARNDRELVCVDLRDSSAR